MSVFTPLTKAQLEDFLSPYRLGALHDFQEIQAGTENSNFFIHLGNGQYVLTLIERGPLQDLPFFIELLERLHAAGFAVPYAITTPSGEALRTLKGKPALLQPCLPGRHVDNPSAAHCAEVGRWLAGLHLLTRQAPLIRKSDRGLDWMQAQGKALSPDLSADEAALLHAALAEIQSKQEQIRALPSANLHADLFRDNVMFEGEHLSGVIDFYNACSGPMLYDLAIALNDWCSQAGGALDLARARALLDAYAAKRPFSQAEATLLPCLLRIAAVRFWLSRLLAARAFAGQDVLIKDPHEYARLLSARQQVLLTLPLAL
ncbi:homoserine kinase [Ventosimonas gracilis]|uniref:Homoserine kinase n=1 Tax=Ventosimonas gracilis TaxID=1680762 RepID=A0A139SU41_9GAMM|nr:homoserine kinase [Ventosimonas gracilis]KXU38034.1 homoserine kinase [Ventosimonas gracilis]